MTSSRAEANAVRIGAIEAGGTKFLCAVRDATGRELERVRIDTTDPDATLKHVVEFFAPHGVTRLGLAMFGPVELEPPRGSTTATGTLLTTPKLAWRGVPVASRLATALSCEVAVDTDVNAAALAELHAAGGGALDPFLYVTVGTGVGGGAWVNGRLLHGLLHPEMGHIRVPRAPFDSFAGTCPSHGDCLEGLVSAPAIAARTGTDPAALDPAHPVWLRVARELGDGLAAMTLILSPKRIVLGGGVLGCAGLREQVAEALQRSLAGYLPRDVITANPREFVVAPRFGSDAGLEGAFLLAGAALSTAR